jgi:hypothetical protein
MKRDQQAAPPSANEPALDPEPALESDSIPDPEPSDPDAAMYAAIRARPDWRQKPKVKQLIKELSEGLGPGEDLFYWDMRRTKPAKPSDAEEHRILTVPPNNGGLAETLPSARVIVQEPSPPRPSPGRNGPRQPANGATEPGGGLPRPPSHRPPPDNGDIPRWCVGACLLALALIATAVTFIALHLGTDGRAPGPTPPAAAAYPSCGR